MRWLLEEAGESFPKHVAILLLCHIGCSYLKLTVFSHAVDLEGRNDHISMLYSKSTKRLHTSDNCFITGNVTNSDHQPVTRLFPEHSPPGHFRTQCATDNTVP